MINYIDKKNYIDLREYVYTARRIDIGDYSEIFIRRKIDEFFVSQRIDTVDNLIARSEQFPELLDLLLYHIGVEESEFFRDPTMWNLLIDELIPELLKKKEILRIYLPDFTTGEELLSLLILLKEHDYTLNAEIIASSFSKNYISDFQKLEYPYRKIGAGENNAKMITHLEDFKSYYSEKGKQVIISKSILKKVNVSFVELNLLKDDLPKDIDIIIFRNKLLYYNRDAALNIIDKLLTVINDKGFFIIGVKDMEIKNGHLSIINEGDRIHRYHG